MRLVHMADLHLGFRQYARMTAGGINQREADVAAAFARAIDKTIEIAPDVVVIGGDVFHTVRPANNAIVHALDQFMRLRGALPNCDVVMVAGNHDTPRTTDSGSILPVFARVGVHVIHRNPAKIHLKQGALCVFAVPDHVRVPDAEPEADAQYNVMLMHGEVAGVPGMRETADAISQAELKAEQWDYVALGHYHVYQQVAPNAYYSGALDWTSSNIWREIDETGARRKGIIEHDLATGAHTFHEVQVRGVIDLPVLDGSNIESKALTEQILAAAAAVEGGIDGQIVRQVVVDIPKHVIRDLDHRAIRKLKGRALNFLLDTRKPEDRDVRAYLTAERKPKQSLEDLLRESLMGRVLPPGIDRDQFVAIGMDYLARATQVQAEKAAASL